MIFTEKEKRIIYLEYLGDTKASKKQILGIKRKINMMWSKLNYDERKKKC